MATLTGAGQRAACVQACRSAHSPISPISPISSAKAIELGRRHRAALGMVPAHQRLEARHLLRRRGRRSAGSAARSCFLVEGLAQVDLQARGGIWMWSFISGLKNE